MTRIELVNELYLNGVINNHKKDMLILALRKDDINVERELKGLFNNGYDKLNKA